MMRLDYRAGAHLVGVQVERRGDGLRVTIRDRAYDVSLTRAAGPVLDVIVNGAPLHGLVAADGERRIVKIDGADPIEFVRVEEAERGRRQGKPSRPPAEDVLIASMHGRVAAVMVATGDLVEAGATLVVLEAMKMEMRLVAPFRGRIRTIDCKPGEVVERGRPLVAIEPVAA